MKYKIVVEINKSRKEMEEMKVRKEIENEIERDLVVKKILKGFEVK